MSVLMEGRVPVKTWLDAEKIEATAREQLLNLAKLPFVFHHVAAMPDVHWGNGTSVGTVFASRGAIIPSAVGVDIGCGMMAVRTNLPSDFNPQRARAAIEAAIPVGFKGNTEVTERVAAWSGWQQAPQLLDKGLQDKAQHQLGSLGGGNHFIEVCRDERGGVWIMLHSGSRNVGKTLAERHIDNAKGIARRYFIELPDPQLAYLADGTPEFGAYIEAMTWAQRYALANREEMMRRILAVLETSPSGEAVNCHHNYIAKENHFGQNVWITRKGAVRARLGDLGIIPGSMGTRSYIVRGKGNEKSFCSCSHGAGRAMSRTAARRRFTVEDLARQTEGVECRKDEGVLDEIPGSYKDIDEVMANQADLVEIAHTLKAAVCVKG